MTQDIIDINAHVDSQKKGNALVVFEGKKIRRTWHLNEWWFSVVDVVAALTDSTNPDGYLKDMRRRDEGLNQGWGQIATPLSILTNGGPQTMNCANTEGAFRLIQSIPSPKAEPFKLWLAKTGYERVQEIQNPELAQERMKKYYELKGYSKEWVDKRLRGIAVRQTLTDTWKENNVKEKKDFAILTNEISKASFDMTTEEYKKLKNLKNENLRDHMNDLELIFTMLGEASTTAIEKVRKPKEMPEHKKIAREGGSVAGIARTELEKQTNEKVVSKENYLKKPEKQKRLESKNQANKN